MEKNLLFSALSFSEDENDRLNTAIVRHRSRLKVHNSKVDTDLEDEILTLPVCARAPLLALYFYGTEESGKKERLHLLLQLYRLAVRIYERHILPDTYSVGGGVEKFAGDDKAELLNVLKDSIFDDCEPEKSARPEWQTPYIKEILADLRRKTPISLNSMVCKYFCVLLMQIIACYAEDCKTLKEVRKESGNDDSSFYEKLYKYRWHRFKLLWLTNVLIDEVPSEETYSEFFGNFSLR